MDDAYNYGASSKGYKLPLNAAYSLTLGSGSQDMAVPAAGTYDVYFSPDVKTVWLMEPGKRPADPEVEVMDPLERAMRRAECNAAFFFTVPGPKMIWQFGELGYDISIEEGGRTGKKPVHWEYYDVAERKSLYDTYANLINFRTENPEFFKSSAQFSWKATSSVHPVKSITCTAAGKTFHVYGNFGSGHQTVTVPAGTWNFKVVVNIEPRQWLGGEFLDKVNSSAGYTIQNGGNIAFSLSNAADVTIKIDSADGKITLTTPSGNFGKVKIDYFSVANTDECLVENRFTATNNNTLKYTEKKERVIKGLKRISKPGLRVYAKSNELPKVLNGLGVAIISTSNGIMTDREARQQKLGGEVIAFVW